MPLTRSSARRLVKLITVGGIILIIVGYAAWRSLDYARGPSITIFEPADGSAHATSTVTIRGQVERVNDLTLNGGPLLIDEAGNFASISVIFPGLNIFTFVARDQFEREVTKEFRLLGTDVWYDTDMPATLTD